MADHTQPVYGAEIVASKGQRTIGAGNYLATGKLSVTRSLGRMELSLYVGHHDKPPFGSATARMGAIGVRRLITALQEQLAFGLPEEE